MRLHRSRSGLPGHSPCLRASAPAAASGERGLRQPPGARHALRRGRLGRLRGRTRPPASWSSAAATPAAHPGLEHQALHHRRGAGPLRRRRPARHRGAGDGRAGGRRHLPRQPLPGGRRRPHLRQPAASRAAPTAAAAACEALAAQLERAGHRARDGPRLRRRVALRLAPRRARVGLPDLALRRPAERPGLQPRPGHRERARLPGQPARLRRRPAGRRPGAAAASRSRAPPAPADAPAAPTCSPRAVAARWRAWRRSPTSRRTTSSPRCWSRTWRCRPTGSGTTEARRTAWPPASPGGSAAGPARLADGSGLSRGNRASPRPRGRSCCWPCASATSSPRSSPRCRSPAATARWARACAAAPARGKLPRQDRHALQRLGGVGLLPRPLGPDLRVLDPDEQREPLRRPRPPGPDAPGDRRPC